MFLARGALRNWRRGSAPLSPACCLLLSVYPAVKYFKHAGRLIRPIRIERTIEYREAMWFDQNMQGRRVLAPGSVGFFLNVFTDTPQFAGGFDQGVVNPLFAARSLPDPFAATTPASGKAKWRCCGSRRSASTPSP